MNRKTVGNVQGNAPLSPPQGGGGGNTLQSSVRGGPPTKVQALTILNTVLNEKGPLWYSFSCKLNLDDLLAPILKAAVESTRERITFFVGEDTDLLPCYICTPVQIALTYIS